jgi:hypothetical protein
MLIVPSRYFFENNFAAPRILQKNLDTRKAAKTPTSRPLGVDFSTGDSEKIHFFT